MKCVLLQSFQMWKPCYYSGVYKITTNKIWYRRFLFFFVFFFVDNVFIRIDTSHHFFLACRWHWASTAYDERKNDVTYWFAREFCKNYQSIYSIYYYAKDNTIGIRRKNPGFWSWYCKVFSFVTKTSCTYIFIRMRSWKLSY